MFFLFKLAFRLFIVLVVLVAVLVGANYGAQWYANKQLASHVRSATKASKVSAHVGSFPFLYEVYEGRLGNIHMVADDVPVGPLRMSQVTVDAKQVDLNSHDLISHHKIEVTSISSADIAVLFETSGITSLAAEVANVSIQGGHNLVISVAGHQLYSVDLTSNPLVPDCDFQLAQIPTGYDLTCSVSPVPSSLLQLLSQVKTN